MGNTRALSRRSKPSVPSLEVTPGFAIWLGLLICLDPAGLILPFLAAAAVHEMGHLICMRCAGVAVRKLRLSMVGASLETGSMTNRQELCCAAAGPLANLLTGVLFFRHSIRFGLLSGLLALFNLLPVWPMDGGRIVSALWPRQAETISRITGCLLFAAGMALTVWFHLGLWPLLLLAVLLAKIAVNRLQEQKLFANRASAFYNK